MGDGLRWIQVGESELCFAFRPRNSLLHPKLIENGLQPRRACLIRAPCSHISYILFLLTPKEQVVSLMHMLQHAREFLTSGAIY